MKLTPLSLLMAVVCCAYTAVAQSRVPETDSQSWNDFQLTIPMTSKIDFMPQLTVRLGDDSAKDVRWGAGFVFKVNKYLSFNPFYFHREARPPHGKHEDEERITLGATVRFPVGKFNISDRNYLERRWRHPQVNAWRYRNRIQIEHPFQIEKKKFTWFVSDEVFYDWSLHVWPRNRAAAGITHPFNKHLTLELYYMRQNDCRTRPGDLNVIWSAWRVKL